MQVVVTDRLLKRRKFNVWMPILSYMAYPLQWCGHAFRYQHLWCIAVKPGATANCQ